MAVSPSPTCCSTNSTSLKNFTINNNDTRPFIIPRDISTEFTYIAIAICSVALLLNATEIFLLMKTWKKLSIFEIWLLNLAASDGLVALAIIIFGGIRLNNDVLDGRTYNILLGLANFVVHFSVVSSSATIVSIALDRLIAIKHPFKHRTWVTKKKIFTVIAIAWVLTIGFSSIEPSLIHGHDGNNAFHYRTSFRLIDAYFIVMMASIFVVAYSTIIYSAVSRWRTTSSNGNSAVNSSGYDCKITNIVVIATCILVVVSYLACMLPMAISVIIEAPTEPDGYRVILVYSNSVLDPLVYFFKRYVGEVLRKREALRRSREKQSPKDSGFKADSSKL